MMSDELTRRTFLEKSVLATAGVGLALTSANCASESQPAITPLKLSAGEKVRVGVLGCGARSVHHIRGINYNKDKFEVVALCDLIPEKMEEKKKLIETGDPALYTDISEMLKRDDMHAVVNITSNTFHKDGTVLSLDAGKHVLCEKPMAMNVTDCKAMVAAGDRNKKALQIGTQRRHSPDYVALEKKIRDGLVGNILYGWVNAFRVDWLKLFEDPREDEEKNWRMRQDLSGGVIYEQGIHSLDLFNWLIGSKPVTITCLGGNNNMRLQKRDSWDHAGVVVQYENGALMTFGGNLYSCGGPGPDVLFGDKATLTFGRFGSSQATLSTRTYWRPFGMGEDPNSSQEKVELPKVNTLPTYLMWTYFFDAITGKKPVFPSGRDHIPALQIARGALQSMAEGRHVPADEVV